MATVGAGPRARPAIIFTPMRTGTEACPYTPNPPTGLFQPGPGAVYPLGGTEARVSVYRLALRSLHFENIGAQPVRNRSGRRDGPSVHLGHGVHAAEG